MQNFWGPRCHSSWAHDGCMRGCSEAGRQQSVGQGWAGQSPPAALGFLQSPAALLLPGHHYESWWKKK